MTARPEFASLEPLLEQLGLRRAAAVLPDWLDRQERGRGSLQPTKRSPVSLALCRATPRSARRQPQPNSNRDQPGPTGMPEDPFYAGADRIVGSWGAMERKTVLSHEDLLVSHL